MLPRLRRRVDKPSLLITFITWAVCVFLDPTYAILVAILLGLLRAAHNEGYVAPARWTSLNKEGSGDELHVYQPSGKWDYTNTATHVQRIEEKIKCGKKVAVCMHDVFLMDVDGVDDLKKLAAAKVPIAGLQEAPLAQCAKNGWVGKAQSEGVVLEKSDSLLAFGAATNRFAATAPKEAHDITQQEILAAQDGWAKAMKAISRAYLDGGDYVEAASKAAAALYAYGHSNVLFKPTKAAQHPFRPTGKEALSYFVGGGAVEGGYTEDSGFAINDGKGWAEVSFANHQIDLNGPVAIAMGTYSFTCATTGNVTKVEYTFGYKKSVDGKLRIFLHHSSVPYKADLNDSSPVKSPAPAPAPSPVVKSEAYPIGDS